ncbi:PKD-like family lipoprotein [Pedobacter sp. ASV28]|uniref:PKD-like family lipoprotein n=1 Tax=Pedobacter sp. ASV28 TaxID=2795123 RepID=UPI0018EB41BB|nr:PKD-like family lipoprotein [Pedobacter sp. ASV28]
MKKQYQGVLVAITLLVGISIMVTGCRKDLGNYTYDQIDSLAIGNILESYQYSTGISANIQPELKFLRGTSFNENDYSYEWAAYTGNTSTKKIIHTEKNLDVALPLPIGRYTVYYVVKQKSTGITWQRRFNLEVFGAFQPGGWFVLNDISGKSRLDYYQENRDTWNSFPVIYRDLTSLIKDVNTGNSMQLSGKPLSITAFYNKDGVNASSHYRLYINTDKETEWINVTTGFTWDKLRYAFSNETVSGEPASVSAIYPGTTACAYAYKDHQLYLYHQVYSLYGTPVNRISGIAGTFPISEHFAAPYNTAMHAIFFDTQNKRFLRSFMSSVGATVLNISGQGLNLANVGKDLVWMGYTRSFNGQAVAILKDAGRYYLARLGFPYPTTTATAITINVTSFEDITDRLTGIATADKFVLDQQYGYLFYVSGSKLYQYDMDNKTVKVAKDYGSRAISLLKVNRLTLTSSSTNISGRLLSPGYGIIVASYDVQNPNTSGTVEFFVASALMGNLTTSTETFSGLGKVVDIAYSEL